MLLFTKEGTFQIQVGHLEPEEISLKGEGSFPSTYLDLPRNIKGNEKYEKVLKEVIEKMEEDGRGEEAAVLRAAVAAEPPPDPLEAVLDPGLQMQKNTPWSSRKPSPLVPQRPLPLTSTLVGGFSELSCPRTSWTLGT
ncbi:hydrocephalus-inducing protein-like [Athene cunicularia]|uniref:hydrocephalus-inducing protein-like n=1 Tax=Athene cunicularia TaxID=194338 RepID=UPI000EF6E1AC|nr:hydrocephalus-inducing protein-like [Athene cunicularia]